MTYNTLKSISLILILLIFYSINLSAQDKDSTEYSYKSPFLSTFCSIALPGGGQLYNGEYYKAGTILTCLGICYGLCELTSHIEMNTGKSASSNDNLVAMFSALGIVGIYIYQIIDAPISSCRINREHNEKIIFKDIGFLDYNAKLNINPIISERSIGLGIEYHF